MFPFSKKTNLDDIRGTVDSLLQFTRAPSVPTVRIMTRDGQAHLELGRRARLRDNSLYDSYDKKGWDITSLPTMIKSGRQEELGYITHPKGVTLSFETDVNIIAVDKFGHKKQKGEPVYDQDGNLIFDEDKDGLKTMRTYPATIYAPVNLSFEGTSGTNSGLDDMNESIGYQREGGWILPFIVGGIVGVVVFAPLTAWVMSFAAHAAGA